MNGTPSCSTGSSRPWKWIAVDCVSLFVSTTFTRSPSRTRICGPGTWPLYAIALTIWPGAVSHCISLAVISKTFTPFTIFGWKGWLP